MALALADGPPGLEATHQWELGGIVLNGLDSGSYPRYKVTKITGWNSLPEIPDQRFTNTGRLGERPIPTWPVGKTITYEGQVEALTYETMRAACSALSAAFADVFSEHRMTIVPHTGWGTQQFFYLARALACDVDDELHNPSSLPSGWIRPFTLSVRLSDPRRYAYPTPVDASAGTSQNVTNLGNAPTDPNITISSIGDVEDVWVRNLSQGDSQLFFRPLPSSSPVVIDFKTRSI